LTDKYGEKKTARAGVYHRGLLLQRRAAGDFDGASVNEIFFLSGLKEAVMKHFSAVAVLSLMAVWLFTGAVWAQQKEEKFDYSPKGFILPLFDKSANILEFDTGYESSFVKDLLGSKGIKLRLKVENSGSKDIVAIQIGFVFFNYFNEPLGYTNALVLDELKTGETKYVDAKAKFTGDGGAYPVFVFVHKIKYANRAVEIVDHERIMKEINNRLGTTVGEEMFENPEERSRRRFGLVSLVPFLM
jgi:hypothetical protein